MNDIFRYIGVVDVAVIAGFLISLAIVIRQLFVILGKKKVATELEVDDKIEPKKTKTEKTRPFPQSQIKLVTPFGFRKWLITGIFIILSFFVGAYSAYQITKLNLIPKIIIRL